MKRLVWLLPLAFVLMWGGVLLDTGRPVPASQPTRGDDEPAAVEERPAVAAAAPAAPKDDAPAPSVVPAVAAAHRVAANDGTAVRAVRVPDRRPMGSSERVSELVARATLESATNAIKDVQVQATEEELLGERGVGTTSPQFVQLETDYASEPRDGTWALAEEQRLAQLFQKHPISKHLALLNCQDSVCRIVLETKSNDAFEQLLSVPGLAEATGLSSSTPYSLRSGQLSVYYRRNDTTAASKTER